MALSGTTTLQLNRDQFVAAAMRKIGVLAKGQAPDAEDLANATQSLNALMAEFQTLGMPLWALDTSVSVLVAGVRDYILSLPSSNHVVQAWTQQIVGGARQELMQMPIYDYERLPVNVANYSIPVQYCYQPQINLGLMRLWPAPSAQVAIDRTLNVIYYKNFDQFTAQTDNAFLPQEWNNAIIYGLAMLLAPEYGVPLQDRGMIQKEAEMHKQMALDAGTEWASLYFQPDRRDYY